MCYQTGEADWGSEMDRHSPTGPCLCCQRSADYMTWEGGNEGGSGGRRISRSAERDSSRGKDCLHSFEYPPGSSHKKHCLHSNFTVGRPVVVTHNAEGLRPLLLTVTTFIIPNDLGAAVFYLFWQRSGGLFLVEQQITSKRLQKELCVTRIRDEFSNSRQRKGKLSTIKQLHRNGEQKTCSWEIYAEIITQRSMM